MGDIKIDDVRRQLQDLNLKSKLDFREEKAEDFTNMLEKALSSVNSDIQKGNQAVNDLMTGGNTNLHTTLLALEKAEISYRLMMEVRGKLISAYQEIMRTSV